MWFYYLSIRSLENMKLWPAIWLKRSPHLLMLLRERWIWMSTSINASAMQESSRLSDRQWLTSVATTPDRDTQSLLRQVSSDSVTASTPPLLLWKPLPLAWKRLSKNTQSQQRNLHTLFTVSIMVHLSTLYMTWSIWKCYFTDDCLVFCYTLLVLKQQKYIVTCD